MSHPKKIFVYLFDASELLDNDILTQCLILNMPPMLRERCIAANNKTLMSERVFLYTLLLYALSKRNLTPEKCNVLFADNGKPYLESREYEFSLSHSKGFVCVAVSEDEVGVDVQDMSEAQEKMVKRLCERFFPNVCIDSRYMSDCTDDAERPCDTDCKIELCQVLPDFSGSDIGFVTGGVKRLCGVGGSCFQKWTECEALLKLDGRGFGALSDINKINEKAKLFSTAIKRESGALVSLSVAVWQ